MATTTKKFFQRPPRLPKNELYGMQGEIKTFYENPAHKDDSSLPRWVEWAPPLVAQRKKKKWDEYAIRLYRNSSQSGSVGAPEKFPVSYVEILSPHIRTTLNKILGEYDKTYDGKDTGPLTIPFPFSPLYLTRHRIAEHAQNAVDSTCREHLSLLLTMIEEELGEMINRLEDLEEKKEITHNLLWALFPLGSVVLQKDSNGVLLASRVIATNQQESEFIIITRDVRFDGSRYGYLDLDYTQPYFSGTKPITELVVYPFNAQPQNEGLREILRDRGLRTMDYQSIGYVQYLNEEARDLRERSDLFGAKALREANVHSRVIVDFLRYIKERPYRARVNPLPGYNNSQQLQTKEQADLEDDTKVKSKPTRLSLDEQERNRKVVSEDPEHLVLINPYLRGFSLTTKSWSRFNVDRVRPLESNSDAYNHLVFSEKSKDVLCALVEDHKTNASLQDDLIAGKGQGLLILLSGPPGTGKTLMAEAVADKTNSPLYYVDAQDLGGVDLDSNLSTIMEDAANWNAVLLLDEADVYISQRSKKVLENEIVSTFLRRLEYFKGTIFLTTNLMDRIDRALESRIHVHLRFSNLSEESRTKVWRNFITKTPELFSELTEDDINSLGEWCMNGREIKNALKMTAAWCRQTKQPITLDAINDVIAITCPMASKEKKSQLAKSAVKNEQVNGIKPVVSQLLEMEDLLQ